MKPDDSLGFWRGCAVAVALEAVAVVVVGVAAVVLDWLARR